MKLFNKEIQKSAELAKKRSILALFDGANNSNRANDFSVSTSSLYLDYSKQNIIKAELDKLISWANDNALAQKIDDMFNGKKKSTTLSSVPFYIQY